MNIFGIIAEYNPFHNGHYLQIQKTRELGATHIVACMSSNFVQRGDTAIFSKFTRAKAALLNGVDLVIELPTPYSLSPARDFAHAGVSLLNMLNINALSFGSECEDIGTLKQSAAFMRDHANSDIVKKALSDGISYPLAVEKAIRTLHGDEYADIIRHPNNMLGVEYINAIYEINPDIEVHNIVRCGAMHDSDIASDDIASASAIRNKILGDYKNYVPKSAYELYESDIEKGLAPCLIENLSTALLYKLRSMSAVDIMGIKDVTEGLHNRIKSACESATSYDELVQSISTKRYTKARIRRILLNCLFDIKADDFKREYEYVRILAMNKKGAQIIKNAKSDGKVISPKFAQLYNASYKSALFEKKAGDVFALASPKVQCGNSEFLSNPIINI